MKKTATVFIWIGMIIQFFLIYPIIVGIFALKTLEKAKNKNDLQTMGILTALFCSLLGGIFMLSIKDVEISDTIQDNKVIIITEKEKIKNSNNENPKYKLKKTLSIAGLYVMAQLLIVSLFVSISICVNYNGVTYLPLLFNILQIGTLTFIIVLYFVKKQKFTNLSYILLCIFAVMSLLQIAFSITSNYCWIYDRVSKGYNFYRNEWVYVNEYETCFESWVTMGIACMLLATTLFLLLYNWITRNTIISTANNNGEKFQLKTTSNVEKELLEVKRLLDNQVITLEEYTRMRESVISKYYK